MVTNITILFEKNNTQKQKTCFGADYFEGGVKWLQRMREFQLKNVVNRAESIIGICTVDDVPDARTIWKYREELTRCGAYDELVPDKWCDELTMTIVLNATDGLHLFEDGGY